jgi:hypothetical protein
LINADAMNVQNLIQQMQNVDHHIEEMREVPLVVFSKFDYIDDTDECVDKYSPDSVKEPRSNYQRLQTKGKASSYIYINKRHSNPYLGSKNYSEEL